MRSGDVAYAERRSSTAGRVSRIGEPATSPPPDRADATVPARRRNRALAAEHQQMPTMRVALSRAPIRATCLDREGKSGSTQGSSKNQREWLRTRGYV